MSGRAPITADVVEIGEEKRAAHAIPHARSYLEAGFTTARDLGNAGPFGDLDLKRAIDRGLLGPRMCVSGPGLSAPGGQIEGPEADIRRVESSAVLPMRDWRFGSMSNAE